MTGSAGSQVSVWNSITFASDGKTPATYSGDKWWPITDPSYIFYASNLPLNFAAAGTTVSASAASSADKDAVCAYMPNPAYKVKNTLSFEHIFARIGKVTVSAGPDYSISAVSISLTPKVSGTYDLAAGAGKSDGTGWSALVDGSATVLASPASIATGGHVDTANDVYLVPGKYTISATWTATRGNYTETFTGMTQEIDIVGGKVNNISTTLVGKATEVEFGVEIAPWGSNEVEVDFLKIPQPTIGGLIFAPGDLYYDGDNSQWVISNHWGAIIDEPTGFYNNWLTFAGLFSQESVDLGDGTYRSIDNMKTIDGFRMPTADEMQFVIDGPRTGSTVNGTPGVRWCYALVNDVHNGQNGTDKQAGIILFPDDMTITNAGISDSVFNTANGSWYNSAMTIAQVNDLVAAGCAFLPASGDQGGMNEPEYGVGEYLTATVQSASPIAYVFSFSETGVSAKNASYTIDEYDSYTVRLVKTAE